MKYLVKPALNMQGIKGFGVCTRTKTLFWCETENEARIDASALELKHLQSQMDNVLATLEKLDPDNDPHDWLA